MEARNHPASVAALSLFRVLKFRHGVALPVKFACAIFETKSILKVSASVKKLEIRTSIWLGHSPSAQIVGRF